MKNLITEEDLKICTLGILGTRCFSSMLPSMPKGEIVSMNVDATRGVLQNFDFDCVCH